MKKLLAALLVSAFALGASAGAETYAAGGYYTIDYPDSMVLDNTAYTDDSTEDTQWLFLLSGDDYLIDAALTSVPDYAGFTLSAATDAEKADYIAEVINTFADSSPSLMTIVNSQSGVPFYVFSFTDDQGGYYYAETIADGMSVNFCCYYFEASTPPDTELMTNLINVLSTYRPMAAESTEDAA